MDQDKKVKAPGPMWKIDDAEDLPLAVIEDTEQGMGICELGSWEHTRKGATQVEWANARLIVAARNAAVKANPKNPLAAAEALPDLFAACTLAWDTLKPCIPPDPVDMECVCVTLCAAIAKAEGG